MAAETGSDTPSPTIIHASAILVGASAVVIRGASGSGKSALILNLLSTLSAAGRFASLIGDDRVALEAHNGRLIVRAVQTIAGLIERRGQGIQRQTFEPAGLVGLIVDLRDGEPTRMPEAGMQQVTLCGVTVKRIELAGFGEPRTGDVLAALDNTPIE